MRLIACGVVITVLAAAGVELLWGPQAFDATTAPAPPGKVLYWTDPMVPGARFDRPGKSPFMDMDLVPVYESDPTVVAVSPHELQLLQVQTTDARSTRLERTILTEGAVTYDERNVYDVTVRVNAKVSRYYPFHVGLLVKKGQPLYELESPEIYSYIDQFLQLEKNAAAVSAVSTDQSHIVRQSETTLLWRGIPRDTIDDAMRTGRVTDRITIRAPITGMIIKRFAVENSLINAGVKTGQFTTYGTPVARIADISFVYVEAKLYADDMSVVKEGMPCEVYPEGLPGVAYAAQVTYVYPVLDGHTRHGIARIAIDNPTFLLKPGMFAKVTLRVPAQAHGPDPVAVPSDALVEHGDSTFVFVAVDESHFQRRQVIAGKGADGWVSIERGLQPGEKVVSNGANFFLDAAVLLKSKGG